MTADKARSSSLGEAGPSVDEGCLSLAAASRRRPKVLRERVTTADHVGRLSETDGCEGSWPRHAQSRDCGALGIGVAIGVLVSRCLAMNIDAVDPRRTVDNRGKQIVERGGRRTT